MGINGCWLGVKRPAVGSVLLPLNIMYEMANSEVKIRADCWFSFPSTHFIDTLCCEECGPASAQLVSADSFYMVPVMLHKDMH